MTARMEMPDIKLTDESVPSRATPKQLSNQKKKRTRTPGKAEMPRARSPNDDKTAEEHVDAAPAVQTAKKRVKHSKKKADVGKKKFQVKKDDDSGSDCIDYWLVVLDPPDDFALDKTAAEAAFSAAATALDYSTLPSGVQGGLHLAGRVSGSREGSWERDRGSRGSSASAEQDDKRRSGEKEKGSAASAEQEPKDGSGKLPVLRLTPTISGASPSISTATAKATSDKTAILKAFTGPMRTSPSLSVSEERPGMRVKVVRKEISFCKAFLQ
ncbi:unnamed protein product [Cylicostephanus goldi]|uniref:Uncharacterized protein n=1 Tax=Cylicostephanus goldi TaxID=71465 RepID=A0A3P6TBP4_CYLGO|nr:unnamed protein product [Cylicostephanus goldi]